MKVFYVYLTTNNINNKKYIGQHFGELEDSYLGSGKILLQAIDKYGKENFSKKILEQCDTQEAVLLAEKKWINFYNAIKDDNFYNIAEGGTGGNTYAGLSEDELSRIKTLRSQQTTGRNNPNYGKTTSEEAKDKMRKTFAERGVSQGKNNPMYGKLGKDNPNSRPIYAIIDEEKVLFDGVREASRQLYIPSPNISRSLTSYGKFSAGKSPNNNRIYWFYQDLEDRNEN